MEIAPIFEFIEGGFDTKDTKMICVQNSKYGDVSLCVKGNKDKGWNIPIAKVKLHSRDLARDADEVFDDAVNLCTEIARRWNECETKF